MKRTRIKSSNLYSMGYDAETKTCEVEFGNGAIWSYWPISQRTYDAVFNADSIGKKFNELIRDVAENSKQVA